MKERNLVDICNEEPFTVVIDESSDLIYCGIGMTKQVMCPYQSKELDHNNLYPCKNPLYIVNEYKMTEQ